MKIKREKYKAKYLTQEDEMIMEDELIGYTCPNGHRIYQTGPEGPELEC